MNTSLFIALRIALQSKRTFSKIIVRIAVLGIMLSLAVMIISVAVVKGFKLEIQEKVRGFSNDIVLANYDGNNSFENIPFVMNDTTLQILKNSKSINFYQKIATKPAIITANAEIEGVNFKGVAKDYHFEYLKSKLVQGRLLSSDSVQRSTELMISKYTADRMKLKIGDQFVMYFVQDPPRKRKFKVVGVYAIGVDEIDKSFVVGDIQLLKRLNKWKPNEIGAVEVSVKDFSQLDQITADLYSNIQMDVSASSVKNNYGIIFEWLSLLDINTQVILILMIVVGVINMISALLIMILERTNMIGILKAIGANNQLIMRIFIVNAAYLIGLGLFLGNVLGVGWCLIQSYTHFFKLDQASYYMSWVPVTLSWVDVLGLNLGTLVICISVMLIPVYLVAKINPVSAIKFK